MIAFDTAAKIGKSPKKPEVEIVDDLEDDEDENSDMDSGGVESEEHELESADEGLGDNESEGSDLQNGNSHENETNKSDGNPGWADAMQKILRTSKPKRKKTVVLSKAKKLCDVVKKEKQEELSFEIDGIKEEIKTEEDESTDKPTVKAQSEQKVTRKDHLGIRVKPSITDRERERTLQKIATKGVVQLFNAVRQQQSEINRKLEEAGPLERKRDKVLQSIDKRAFLDVLMGGSKSVQVDNDVKDEEEKENATKEKDDKLWSVLRDDFVMGAKLKDWDKRNDEEDEDNDSSAPEDMDSDD